MLFRTFKNITITLILCFFIGNGSKIAFEIRDFSMDVFRVIRTQNIEYMNVVENRLKNLLSQPERGGIVIDKKTGEHISRLSVSGKRILKNPSITNKQILQGIEEGHYEIVSQQELVDKALENKKNSIVVFTGGGDAAGINAVWASAAEELNNLNQELNVLGIKNAGAGLTKSPEEFPSSLIFIDNLLIQDARELGSTILGSSRIKPFKKIKESASEEEKIGQEELRDRAMANLEGFGGLICTGGDDNLKTANDIAQVYPDMFIVATAKTIDGDVMVNGQGVQCLGFNTAKTFYKREFLNIARSAATHGEDNQPVIIMVEMFGRDTGRLAFESSRFDNTEGLTDAEIRTQIDLADTILQVLPEHPVTIDVILDKIKSVLEQENSVVVAVAEGYRPKDNPDILIGQEVDHAGHPQLTGMGELLRREADIHIPVAKVRLSLLNYEGRGAVPTDYDWIMGVKIGKKMAQLISEGVTGGKFVGYLNEMNPFEDDPVVLELTDISNGNTLKLYPIEILRENRVILDQD